MAGTNKRNPNCSLSFIVFPQKHPSMAEHLQKAMEEQKEGNHNGDAEPEGMYSPFYYGSEFGVHRYSTMLFERIST